MLQFCKLLLAHAPEAMDHPDGRKADGWYMLQMFGVRLHHRDGTPFAFVGYPVGSGDNADIQSVEPGAKPGDVRALGRLTDHDAETIGIDPDTDDVGKIGYAFLLDCGFYHLRTPEGLCAWTAVFNRDGTPPDELEVFQCEAETWEKGRAILRAQVPDANKVMHIAGRDAERALDYLGSRWHEGEVRFVKHVHGQ